jgi:hypothetical protein
MKNIHVLATDKPSRLTLSKKGLFLQKHIYQNEISKSFGLKNQHIYITSSEEIKEGDWMYYKHFGEDIVYKYDAMNGQNTNVNEHKPFYQKIILTTDQSLDGVQAIQDDFLEWFVNNPKCEEVEVEKIQFNPVFEEDDLSYDEMTAYYSYKIIIPKKQIISSEEDAKIFVDAINNAPEPNEKLKKAFKNFKYVGECKGNQNGCFLDSCGHDCGCFTRVVKEEPKQETTLEKAAEYFAHNYFDMHETNNYKALKQGFEDGAKWQADDMIEKLEMHIILNEDDWSRNPQVEFKSFVEQFKKK